MYEIVSADVINFSWAPPSTDQHNGVLRMYHLECRVTPGDSPLSRSLPSSELTGTLSGFTPARQYSCQVRAATDPGVGLPATLTVITCECVCVCVCVCVCACVPPVEHISSYSAVCA